MKNKERPTIIMYTDGAASGNPGPGGYGVVLKAGNLRKELSGGFKLTTNNRMELLAVIRGLETIKWENARVKIFTDSKYVADAVNKGWIYGWEKKDYKKRKNPDLWKKFLKLYRKHNVEINWIKGHADIPENERCDRLAVEAGKGNNLAEDTGYDPGDKKDLFE
ncbi:MAG: ribonuclease HI [Bacteroidota bacterium]